MIVRAGLVPARFARDAVGRDEPYPYRLKQQSADRQSLHASRWCTNDA